jgi:ribose 5-phosphate isomerase B
MSNISKKYKIYLGADHAGFELKEKVLKYLQDAGFEVFDFGAKSLEEFDDYPDYISPVAESVSCNPDLNRGIIFGGSGQGEAIVANRYPNVRATVYYGGGFFADRLDIIELGRKHNNSNILSMGARFVKFSLAKKAIDLWLRTAFSGEEKHIRRIKKIEKISRDVKCKIDIS